MDKKEILTILDDLDPESKKELLLAAINATRPGTETQTAFGQNREKTVEVLKRDYRLLLSAETFSPGQLVTWKQGLKNRLRPVEGEPGIVVEVLTEPIVSEPEGDSGSPYYRERLDIRIGVLGKNEQFMVFHYDSRRFTDYSERQGD
jgi:hypothetical protein